MATINPGNTWSTIINANTDADEVFTVTAGTHTGQTAPLRSGQKLLFQGGVTVNGNGVSTLGLQTNQPDGIEVGGLDPDNRPDIHSYAPGNQQAVITAINGGSGWGGDDWYLHDMILRDSADSVDPTLGWGVDMGDNTTLRRLDISGMGKAGVNWSGPNGGFTQGSSTQNCFRSVLSGGGTIDDCDIHDNAPNGGADSGGISKIVHGAKGRVIRNSRFEGNFRANIWCDFLGSHPSFDQMGVLGRWSTGWLEIVNCDLFGVVSGPNQTESLFLEVTSGVFLHHSRIYMNQSVGGGQMDGAHIIAHNAAFNTVEDNIIYDNGTRSFGVHQSARYGGGKLITCEGNAFRRNKVYAIDTAVTFISGLSNNANASSFELLEVGGGGTFNPYADGNNVWEDNEYFVINALGSSVFSLAGNGGNRTFAQWQAAGFDVNGSYLTFDSGSIPPLPPMPSLDAALGSGRGVPEARISRANANLARMGAGRF